MLNGLNPLPSKQVIDDLVAARKAAAAVLSVAKVAAQDARDELAAVDEAGRVATAVANAVQANAHRAISSVVSRCLEAVFDDPYEFDIVFEQKRGRTEASLVFKRDGGVYDPLTATGGGVVDVAAFALRLACLCLSRPPSRRLLLLDEPFRFVWAGGRAKVRELLETLANEMGVQIIMVTHIEALRCGTVVEIGNG